MQLALSSLREMYKSGTATPSDVIAAVYERIAAGPVEPVWITLFSREKLLSRARKLEQDKLAAALPLYGVPFAVKDNIDVAGLPTTAACPAFRYVPGQSAEVVRTLIGAGAIPVGKTNMDQFATGLVGTRTPHGACSSVYNARYISGGSSSGSAVAVASGLVSFALGTDTAGSGRVPAAFNGLVGLKPTRGAISTQGVIPACRTLDCVSIFALSSDDASSVRACAAGFDPEDAFSREPSPGSMSAPWTEGEFTFGVPPENQLQFFGNDDYAELYQAAVARLESIGGRCVPIDFAPFQAAAQLLYSGPWVAERYAAIRQFIEQHADAMDPVVRSIIEGARRYSAADGFDAQYRLAALRRAADVQMQRVDALVLPTAPTIYTHEEIAAEPVQRNTNLGFYTNFVNLLDMAAVALPARRTIGGLPFGISLIGPAFTEEALLALGARFDGSSAASEWTCPPGCVPVAVVGAHLTGQPLNWQLTERGARRLVACRTAPDYRLYALDGTMPPKPGLVRDQGFSGPGIEVEVWAVPEHQFGGFVAAVPPPLGIGNATLEDGRCVKSFICEPYAVRSATEITRFGGWKHYLAQPPLTR